MWAATTRASNWMMTQYYVRDTRPIDGGKIPPMPRIYLYPEVRVLFPQLPPRTAASLEHSIQRQYRAKRFDVSWRSSASLPTIRYPQPFPIPSQSWSYSLNEHNQPLVCCRIGERQWELRLKSGARYRRQIQGMRRMVEPGEMAIYKAHDGTMLVKLVGWLDRPLSNHIPTGTLIVRTGKESLLSAVDVNGHRIWTENCDHLLRWITAHRKRLRRLSEDQKAEQRPVASFAAHRRILIEKHQRRMNSAIQEIAAQLVNFTTRRHCAKVSYDDSEHWLDEFPYFMLADRIRTKLDEHGIAFEKIGASVTEKEE